jgi:pyrimidine operon attenuation protein/uracil phosphoribosyltransferase
VGVSSRTVLSASDIDRAVTRIAHEILESNHGVADLVILGIPTRGTFLAKRIVDVIARTEDIDPAEVLGQLDITMYRDDLSNNPTRAVGQTNIPSGGLDSKVVVLVDDVLFSGRTIRAALDALNDYGRPSAVRLAVLIDRGHRELPIRADFVGKNLPTSSVERIRVHLAESDEQNQVVIEG